ncbi:Short chain dehydrogenase [Pleurostoma richardsiae]|uniref:Short chain dehydrogenase n=1 Tax=Pleurostoma richardsiae TaxID=41990 RepID=A0AA38VMT2_9PEZI|nr:Short chain dehydrogenase [Pleurostoma richardsiae]
MADIVFLLTAASSGFGKHVAQEALKRGHKVIATARDPSRLADLAAAGAHVMALDVTADEATLAAKLDEASRVYGKITHVVNAAGYVLEGAVEEASQEEIAASFNTNVFGVANITRAAAPHLRAAAASGAHCVLAHYGSLASWSSGPGVALYCSTKSAVSGMVEGIRAELAPFGVAVCAIEPGYFRTGFLNAGTGATVHRIKTARVLPVYEGTPVAQMRAMLDGVDEKQPGDPARGARVIVDVLTGTGCGEGRDVPVRLVLGSDCVQTIREKCRVTEELLREWEEVAKSTDF